MGGPLLTLHWFIGLVGDIASGLVTGLFDHYILLIAGAAAIMLAGAAFLFYFSRK